MGMMAEFVPAAELAAAAQPKPAKTPALHSRRDIALYLLLAALVLGAWGITRLNLYDSKSNLSYWMGVAGGVMMLLLLTYPMRKHLRFMQRFGAGSRWFVGHMVLGIGGPLLILLHSTFHIGSLNAGVAFFAMLIVAGSGVIGRFLYVRLHSNLNGVKVSLGQLREVLDLENESAARLRFAPAVLQRCQAFEAWTQAHPTVSPISVLRNLVLLPGVRWRAELACRRELRRRMVVIAHAEGWSRRKFEHRLRGAQRLVHDYLEAAHRVAQFSVFERLFSWWHVAHVPFVYMLIVSAIAHVIAVHAY